MYKRPTVIIFVKVLKCKLLAKYVHELNYCILKKQFVLLFLHGIQETTETALLTALYIVSVFFLPRVHSIVG